MDEVSSQEEVVKVLRKTMETKNVSYLYYLLNNYDINIFTLKLNINI